MNIDHIGIVVRDLDAAREFFATLGFTVVRGGHLEGQWIDEALQLPHTDAEYLALQLPMTQTKIEILSFNHPQGQKDPFMGKANQIGIRHLALAVDDIEAIMTTLKLKGFSFFSDIQVYEGQKKFCYFTGFDDIIFELAEYL
jgi:catechol 2,3-dioxygenase-like lactoylglutathione lyase family enzyme